MLKHSWSRHSRETTWQVFLLQPVQGVDSSQSPLHWDSALHCTQLFAQLTGKGCPDYWTDNCRHLQVCTPSGAAKD